MEPVPTIRTCNEPAAPLVVTLRMGHDAAAHFTELRRAHFPPQRNWLDAHVTLFHALPGSALGAVLADAAEVAAATAPFTMRTERLLFLGCGVAYALSSTDAVALRRALAQRWRAMLGRQDRAEPFRPHVTVQNKVAPEVARALHACLAESFEPQDVPAVGLEVWHYAGGPWRHAASFAFTAAPTSTGHREGGTRRQPSARIARTTATVASVSSTP